MTKTRDYLVAAAAISIIMYVFGLADVARTAARQAVQQVFVTNSIEHPVWVRDVESARQPVQVRFDFEIKEGAYGLGGLTAMTVPAQKRLVIEYASFRLSIPQGQRPQDGPTIQVMNGGKYVEYWLPPPTYSGTLADTTYIYVSSNPVTLYADPGTIVSVGAGRSELTGTARVRVMLSGYLVNVP